MSSKDGATRVDVTVEEIDALPADSVFATLAEASSFFQRDSLGYSRMRAGEVFEGIELKTASWEVKPLKIEHVRSTYFEDADVFPAGSAEPDCALVMSEINADWRAVPRIASLDRAMYRDKKDSPANS